MPDITPTLMPSITPTSVTSLSGAPQPLVNLDNWMIFVIVICALGALVGSLLIFFHYIGRLRMSQIHHDILSDSLQQSYYRELLPQEGLYEGDTPEVRESQRNEAGPRLEDAKKTRDRLQAKKKEFEAKNSKLDDKELKDLEMATNDIEFFEREIRGRLSQEQIAELNKKILKIWAKAGEKAEGLVPPSLTVAGLGLDGSFFIQITAILTIIFGIIILGLVRVLSTAEIAPILAAIAGYVLGKTTGVNGRGSTSQRPAASLPPAASPPPATPSGSPPKTS